MNLMNKMLILIILIFLINYLSDGQISKIVKNIFNKCKHNIENFMGLIYNPTHIKSTTPNTPYQSQKDFPYNNHNDINVLDDETYSLYKFLNNLITVNVNIYELTPHDSTRVKVCDKLKKEIYDELNKIFNCNEYSFKDITFLSELYYYQNYRGKDIEPFEFKSSIAYKKKSIGTVVIYVECFIREDKFNYQTNQLGFLTLQTIKLINRTYSDGKSREKVWRSAYKLIPAKNEHSIVNNILPQCEYKNVEPEPKSKPNPKPLHINNDNKIKNKAQKQNIELTNKMVESFTDHFVDRENYNELFIKPSSQNQASLQSDTENSLIPSNIEFSACM